MTLIELILVMTLLLIVLSVSSPSLARFFRGRNQDAEARRFLSLTRYGQSRAVAEGIPMILWLDAEKGRYGMQAESSYEEVDRRAVVFELEKNLRMQVQSLTTSVSRQPRQTAPGVDAHLPLIRFAPDGYLSQESPSQIWFIERDQEDSVVAVGQNQNRRQYEIQTNLLTHARL
jgi:Tfp pilus assembly protein FimT